MFYGFVELWRASHGTLAFDVNALLPALRLYRMPVKRTDVFVVGHRGGADFALRFLGLFQFATPQVGSVRLVSAGLDRELITVLQILSPMLGYGPSAF